MAVVRFTFFMATSIHEIWYNHIIHIIPLTLIEFREHAIKLEYMPESVAYCITLIFHNCGKKQISLESSSTINFNMASETDKYSNWNSSSATFYILPVKLPTEVMNKKKKKPREGQAKSFKDEYINRKSKKNSSI